MDFFIPKAGAKYELASESRQSNLLFVTVSDTAKNVMQQRARAGAH